MWPRKGLFYIVPAPFRPSACNRPVGTVSAPFRHRFGHLLFLDLFLDEPHSATTCPAITPKILIEQDALRLNKTDTFPTSDIPRLGFCNRALTAANKLVSNFPAAKFLGETPVVAARAWVAFTCDVQVRDATRVGFGRVPYLTPKDAKCDRSCVSRDPPGRMCRKAKRGSGSALC